MPSFMHVEGIDGDVTASGADRGSFATGETLVHIEASSDPDRTDLIFGTEDSTTDTSNVEVLIKVLDVPGAHAQGETLVHVESGGWLLV
jgi:hypothetical protein